MERIDLGHGSSMTGYESREEWERAASEHAQSGGVMLLGRIMVRNIPECEGGTIVDCPSCGEKCWKRDIEPDPLPHGVVAVCTSCMLRKRIPKSTT